MRLSRRPHPVPRIELLHFAGCPGAAQLLPELRALAQRTGASLELRAIETPEQADAARFLGSPTVLVDGRDVEPGAQALNDHGLKCRLYRLPSGDVAPAPPVAWVEAALRASARLP